MNNNFENYRGAFDKDFKKYAKKMPMKWYDFLVKFMLWISAGINILSSVSYIGGSAHSAEIYASYPGLSMLDIGYGVLTLGMGALAIMTRFALVGYKRNAPALASGIYFYGFVISLGYNIFALVMMQSGYDTVSFIITVMSVMVSSGISLAVAICNLVYFKKRKHMFTK